jgi:hypothetical protein
MNNLHCSVLIFFRATSVRNILSSILSKKSNAGGIITLDFKLYYKATVTKASWNWPKSTYLDQWTRIGDPEINSHSYNHLILEKGVEKHSVEKR